MNAQIDKSLISLGLLFILLSFLPGILASEDIRSDDGVYVGVLVITTGGISIDVANSNDDIILYVLDYEAGIRLIAEQSLENVTPIYSIVVTDRYSGNVGLTGGPAYLIVVTNATSAYMYCTVSIWRATPNLPMLLLGAILLVIGLFYGRSWLIERMDQIGFRLKPSSKDSSQS